MSITIYHNPRCSKSRQTLELLNDNHCETTIVEYLHTPPDADTLRHVLQLLGITPRQLLRTGEDEYKALGLADPSLEDEAIIQAMVNHPRLIERPIVVVDNQRAVIGRPPERVLEILT